MNSKLTSVVLMMVLPLLNCFIPVAKVGLFYGQKGCEGRFEKSSRSRYKQDISDGDSLSESCDKASRKAMGSSGKGNKKRS